MTRAAVVLVTLLAVSATVGRAEAEDVTTKAKAAFRVGKSLFEEGKYAEAAEAFRTAYEIRPNWKLFYNIGQCEALAKRHGLALQAFESYLSQGGDDIPGTRREEVFGEVERLRKMVGAVEVRAPDGAIIYVDGVERERAPLPGPMMVAAGVNHQIAIKLGDDVLLERQVRVSGGQTVEVVAEAGTAPAVEPAAAPVGEADEPEADEPELLEVDEERDPVATWGWVALGVGGAALIGAAVTGSMALSIDKDLQDKCQGGECGPDYWDDNDKLKAMATTTDVLIGVGGALAATGIVLLIVSAGGEEGDDEGETDVALVPFAGPGLAGATVQGRF